MRVRSVDREPIVYNDNEPTRVQTCDDDANLFPGETSIALRPCAGKKRGWQKSLGDAWVSFYPTDVGILAW